MTAIIADPHLEQRLIEERRRLGADKYDEVWEGVYVMSPLANNEHQQLTGRLFHVLFSSMEEAGLGSVYPGANVSDRESDWKENFRCPDVLVFLSGNTAEDRDSHWFGGPDFAVEVASQGERTYEKLDFYFQVHTTEVLVVDRHPWQLVLFRRGGDAMVEVGRSTLEDPQTLTSGTVPLSWKLSPSEAGPAIEVAHHDGQQNWIVRSG